MRLLLVCGLLFAASARADGPGQAVWMARCKGCHGVDGRARTQIGAKEKIADLTSPAWQKSFADPDIRAVVADGSASNPKMKPFGDKLSSEELDAVVGYIRTLKAP